MKQEWVSLTIHCDSEYTAKQREVSLSRNDKIKDIKRDDNKVSYKQLTWVDEDE